MGRCWEAAGSGLLSWNLRDQRCPKLELTTRRGVRSCCQSSLPAGENQQGTAASRVQWALADGSSEGSFHHLKEHPSLPRHSLPRGGLCSPVWAAQSGGKSTEKRVFLNLLQFSLEQGGGAGLTVGLGEKSKSSFPTLMIPGFWEIRNGSALLQIIGNK